MTVVDDDSMISAWGDSLTIGVGVTPSNDYVSVLGTLTNRTVRNMGVAGETSTQVVDRLIADTAHRNDTVVLWLGTNNSSDMATILADAERAVAWLGHSRYVIAGPLNRSYEYFTADPNDSHRQAHDRVLAVNAALAARFGIRYVDLRRALVDAYNPNVTEDVTDHALDIPPRSLRSLAVPGDDDGTGKSTVHQNNAGYTVIAKTAAVALQAIGLERSRIRVVSTPTAGETIAVFDDGGILQNMTVKDPMLDATKPTEVFTRAEAQFVA